MASFKQVLKEGLEIVETQQRSGEWVRTRDHLTGQFVESMSSTMLNLLNSFSENVLVKKGDREGSSGSGGLDSDRPIESTVHRMIGQLTENMKGEGSSQSLSNPLVTIKLADGSEKVCIGKISYITQKQLGKGSFSTYVYEGNFEERKVAVKRIKKECFEFAQTEVELLNRSDSHSNIIRYICMESCVDYIYIALELCVGNLSQFIVGGKDGLFKGFDNRDFDTVVSILRGATEGLDYIHSLGIVHRDVKPENILLRRVEERGGRLKALISDFGLGKKLPNDKFSFSNSGGDSGTYGWIAREVIMPVVGVVGDKKKKKLGTEIDVFSLGCVYYYVLSNGAHPFGSITTEPFVCQFRICSGTYELDLSGIRGDSRGACEIIRKMINPDPAKRPNLHAVLKCPVFWGCGKIMRFFVRVKEAFHGKSMQECGLLKRYENNRSRVITCESQNWTDMVDPAVAESLLEPKKTNGKRMTLEVKYNNRSIRDLVKAIRDKHCHFSELSDEAKKCIGDHVGEKYVCYWLRKFPGLLGYTWEVFEGVKDCEGFGEFYDGGYDFFGGD